MISSSFIEVWFGRFPSGSWWLAIICLFLTFLYVTLLYVFQFVKSLMEKDEKDEKCEHLHKCVGNHTTESSDFFCDHLNTCEKDHD